MPLPVGLRRCDAETWSQLSTERSTVGSGAKRSQRPEKETIKVRGEAALRLEVSERLSATDGSRLTGNLLQRGQKIRFVHENGNRREVLKPAGNTRTLLNTLCLCARSC